MSAAASPSLAPLLDVRDLKTYLQASAGLARAVDGVSFTLRQGETLGIVGESGSGKTVLTRSVLNILPRRSAVLAGGSVLFRGMDLRRCSERELRRLWGAEMGVVFQDPMSALNPVLTVGAQVMEPLRLHLGMSRPAARERAVALLREVGIPAPEDRMASYPHQLSGGMRQRVIIAIALACGPSLLIADEPTTALDVTVQKQILDLLAARQAERNMAMLLVTHDLGVVASRCDEVAVMYAGRIVERAPTAAIFRSARHPYTEALLRSIPRISNRPHTRLLTIPGQPPSLVDPPAGCRFAQRCRNAQQRCLVEDPPFGHCGASGAPTGHGFACFYPVGTGEGERARERNVAAGRNAAGTPVPGLDARMDGGAR